MIGGVYSSKMVKIFKLRSSHFKSLDISQINELNQLASAFSSTWTRFSGQNLASLRSTLAQCERDFIDAFHQKKIAEISATIEGETWNKVEIPDSFLKTIRFQR